MLNNDREIKSAKDVFQVVSKAKGIIIGLTGAAILVSGVYFHFIAKPIYEVNSSVLVSDQTNPDQIRNIDLSPYVQQVKSSFIVQRLSKEINGIGYLDFINSLALNTTKDSNIVNIKARRNDPREATQIANIAAMELGSLIEISSRLEMNIKYEKDLDDVSIKLAASSKELQETKTQLDNTNEILITQKSLINDPNMLSIVSETAKIDIKSAAGLIMKSEDINPVFISLKGKFSEKSIEVVKLDAESEALKSKIETNKDIVNEIQKQDRNISMDQFTQNVNKYKSVLITPAMEPQKPINSKANVYIVLAGIAAFFLSLLLVFSKEFFFENK